MTIQEVIKRGWSLPIFKAITAAGGPMRVAFQMGYKTQVTPLNWVRTGRMPYALVKPLCKMAGREHNPQTIFDDMKAREMA